MKTLLMLALAFSFVACNKQASTDAPTEPAVETAAPVEAAPADAAPEAAPAAEGEAN